MSEELKPCPFCNSAALVRERHTDDGKPFFVECQGWEFDCGITVAYAATAEQSASLWNRRASGDGGKSEAVELEALRELKDEIVMMLDQSDEWVACLEKPIVPWNVKGGMFRNLRRICNEIDAAKKEKEE